MLLFAFCFVSAAHLFAFQERQTNPDDRQLISGLLERRLFDLAESTCQRNLKQQELNSYGHAIWTVDLLRIQSAIAADAAPQQSGQQWETVGRTAKDFADFFPDHPFQLLVKSQYALSILGRAQQNQQEILVGMRPATDSAETLVLLRRAFQLMDEAERSVDQSVLKASDRATDAQMSRTELQNMKTNLAYQKSVCNIDRASQNSAANELDQADIMRRAIEELDQVTRTTNREQPMWWQAQLQLARARRVQGDLNSAVEILRSLNDDQLPPRLVPQVQLEKFELLLEAGAVEQMNTLVGEINSTVNRTVELDLVLVRAAMFLANRSDDSSQQSSLRNQALQLARQIKARHGNYWGQRASLVVSGDLIGENSQPTDGQILLRVAAQAEQDKKWTQAIQAYDQAAESYQKLSDHPNRKRVMYRAALIAQQEQQHADASNRFFAVRKEFPASDEAAQANLAGIWNFSQTIPEVLQNQQYLELLDEHLQLFSNDETVWRARSWRAVVFESRKQYRNAVYDLLAIDDQATQAAAALERCEKLLDRAIDENTEDQKDFLLTVAGSLESRLGDEAGQLPDQWRVDQRMAALILARLNLVRLNSSHNLVARMLSSAAEGAADEPWSSKANALLVVAYAVNDDKRAELKQALAEVQDVSAWEVLADGLNGISKFYRDDKAKSQLADVQILVNESLAKQFDRLDDKQKVRWSMAKALALETAGDRQQAIAELEKLSQSQPREALVQLEFARMLSRSSQDSDWQKGLDRWRVIANRTKKNSASWYEAKFHVAELLLRSGNKQEARQLLEYIKAIPPGWENSSLKTDFDDLLIKCSG